MKSKSFFKSYGILIIVLAACITGLVFLGISIFKPDKPKVVLMKDLTNLSKEEVVSWVGENSLEEYINYSYEYSLDVEENSVISQSLGKNVEVNKKFDVVISKGSVADVSKDLFIDKNAFDAFINNYKNVIVTYKEEENDADAGIILSFSKDKVDLKKDELTVTISIGKKEEKEEPKEEKDDKEKVLIPNNLLGMEESKFIKTLNDLGFKNLKKDSQKYYSFNSKKDTIFSYDDGNFETSRTINYAISFGDYISAFNKADYEGKTLEVAKKTVEKYNALNAHITLNTKNVSTSNSSQVGLLSNCSASKGNNSSIITCNLYVQEEKSATIPNDLYGKSESDFKNALNKLGFNSLSKSDSKYSSYPKDTVYQYTTGTKKLSDTISYALSLGTFNCDFSKLDGQTSDSAKSYINNENNKGANVKLVINNVPDDTKTKNTLYDCLQNGNTITCKLANNKDKYNIVKKSTFIQIYSKTSYDATKAAVEDIYKANFVNLHFNAVTSEYAVGTIVDVRVNGSSTYAEGAYDYDCSFEVDICSAQE